MKKGNKRTYLDYAASTPIDKRVSAVMKRVENLAWANASSLHEEGEKAKKILEEARTEIARILRTRASEIIFTSGGTEAANIAIQGSVVKVKEKGINPHIIISSIEHPAVLETVKSLAKWGVEISIISPNEEGIINPDSIGKEIKENTVLVCLMHSNNEIGTIQPVKKVASIIAEKRKEKGSSYPYLLSDASQSALYEDVSPERLGVDILILDGIKMYGPRGAGILFVKTGVLISPVIFGGGQERSFRSGTENPVIATGLASALNMAAKIREKESKRLTFLRDYAIEKLLKEILNSSLNGDQKNRLPNNVNICLHPKESPWDSEFLVIKLDTLGFAVSAASACSNLNLENSSYVIESLGKKECANSSLRFTFGRETKKSDIDRLISTLKKIVKLK